MFYAICSPESRGGGGTRVPGRGQPGRGRLTHMGPGAGAAYLSPGVGAAVAGAVHLSPWGWGRRGRLTRVPGRGRPWRGWFLGFPGGGGGRGRLT